MNKKIIVLIKKEIKQVFSDKQVFIPMIIFPSLLLIVIPLFLLYDPISGEITDKSKEIFIVSYNLIFPTLFFMTPIMTSAVIASASFVNERVSGTIESLLYCPITISEILISKILGAFAMVYSITLAYSVIFGCIVNFAGRKLFLKFLFPDTKWVIIIFWVAPAIALFTITITVIISAKVKSFEASQQITSFLSLPVVAPIIGQFSGYYSISNIGFMIGGTILLILDYLLIKIASKKFVIEKLVND